MAVQNKIFAYEVVVTGASAGIKQVIAEAFAKEGAHIGVISRNEERLLTLKNEFQDYGVQILVLPLDIAHDVEREASRVEQELGPIDIWVNNAMFSMFSPVKEMKAEEYKRVT